MKNSKLTTLAIVLIALLCVGCSKYTNEQLVKDAKYCTDNGFDYEIRRNSYSGKPFAVYCTKKS